MKVTIALVHGEVDSVRTDGKAVVEINDPAAGKPRRISQAGKDPRTFTPARVRTHGGLVMALMIDILGAEPEPVVVDVRINTVLDVARMVDQYSARTRRSDPALDKVLSAELKAIPDKGLNQLTLPGIHPGGRIDVVDGAAAERVGGVNIVRVPTRLRKAQVIHGFRSGLKMRLVAGDLVQCLEPLHGPVYAQVAADGQPLRFVLGIRERNLSTGIVSLQVDPALFGNDLLHQVSGNTLRAGPVTGLTGHAGHLGKKPHHRRRLGAVLQIGNRFHVRSVIGRNRAALINTINQPVGKWSQIINNALVPIAALIVFEHMRGRLAHCNHAVNGVGIEEYSRW